VPESTVRSWAAGLRVPDPENCDRIAEAFGMDVDAVLTVAGHRPAIDELSANDPRRRLHALIDRIQWTPQTLWFIEKGLEALVNPPEPEVRGLSVELDNGPTGR
jgi:hypothetical protein